MSFASHNSLSALTNTQAKELAGRLVMIGGRGYYFKKYSPDQPGQPPWRRGAEGKAYPLVAQDGSVAAYVKFFTRPTQKRLDRTTWLIGQRMHTWLPGLAAAPLVWADTRRTCRPVGVFFDFAGYLAVAVPGETWLEVKSLIHDGKVHPDEQLRWRYATGLVHILAVLEQAGLVHGDLSPNNIVIRLNPQPDAPALYLIDFDAFVAPAAGPNGVITVAEGGTYGTEGYCPPDLAAAVHSGDRTVAPYSDRYGRDMLLLELLLMDSDLPSENPPASWDRDELQRRYAALRTCRNPEYLPALSHLDPASVFALPEQDRPTSTVLAAGLGLSLPKPRVLQRFPPPARPTPSVRRRRASHRADAASPVCSWVPDDVLLAIPSGRSNRYFRSEDARMALVSIVVGGGLCIVVLAVLAFLLIAMAAESADEIGNELMNIVGTIGGVLGGLACLGCCILLSVVFGYAVTRD